ncbi:MAG: hypothetical protein IBX72_15000 [Nitrospirae bacterium]|nr:hypothetical protein [Nitrospirota bacterium]
MRKLFLTIFIFTLFNGSNLFAAEEASRDINSEETSKVLSEIGLMHGNFQYVKSAGTSDKDWNVHLFKVKNENLVLPLLTYVNKSDIVVGILIRDGKLVIPEIPVEELQPFIEDIPESNIIETIPDLRRQDK